MDPATLIGIGVAFAAIYAMVALEGADITSLLLPAPMILVFGVTIAVTVASGTLGDVKTAVAALPRAFRGKPQPLEGIVDDIVEVAEVARRDGLLSLEQEADRVEDPFLQTALRDVADGMDAEELRLKLGEIIDTRERTDRTASHFFTTMGGYAPTVGIIGTVVSLTHVLENLDEPSTLGHSIAAAFVATLWGLLSSNLIWLPIGNRLARLSDLNVERMNLVMEGMLSVQSGSGPRVLGERLRAMVPGAAAKAAKAASDKASADKQSIGEAA